MKVVLTGHTRGIGGALNRQMLSRGWEVSGFSQSTGYNLNSAHTFNEILREAETADIFINNAHHGFAQTNLLYDWFNKFRSNTEKIHVIVGSHAADFVHSHPHRYEIQKRSIDHACQNLWFSPHANGAQAKVILAKLGLTDTDMVKGLEWAQGRPSLTPDYVAEKILWTIDQALLPGGYIREISISP